MKNIKVTFSLFVYLMIFYSIFRILFYFINKDFYTDLLMHEILVAFLVGFRFDIAAILMLNLPVLILYNLPVNLLKFNWYKTLVFSVFCLLNILGLVLNIADFGYFPTIQRRLLYEPYTMLPDIIRMIPSLFIHYAHLIIGFIAASILFVWFTLILIKKINSGQIKKFSFIKSFAWFLTIIVLSVIGIRGGVQLKPIRQTNAFFSDNRALGYLALNSTYTVLRSYFQYTLPDYKFYDDQAASKIVNEMIYSKDETIIDSNFVFMRSKIPSDSTLKRNVVIFIMESWSAQLLGSISKGKTFTPFFDSLANHGLLFTNFLANGARSIEAVPSILSSLPGLFPQSIIGSRSEISKSRGLGSVLLEHGYETSFHHGAKSGSMGFDAFVPSAGFLKYYTEAEYLNYADSVFDGVWGIYDEPFFLDAAIKINEFKKPFCSVIFSLSSHDPFTVPVYRSELLSAFANETELEQSLRYSDFSLQQFFNYAQKQSWFDNTIFLITADHTLYSTRNNLYEAFHIPLLIYSPQIEKPRVINEIGSHADILPTILDLLKIKTIHSSMGKSLLDSTKENFTVVLYSGLFCFFSNRFLYTNDFENVEGLYDYHKDALLKENLIHQFNNEAIHLKEKLLAYVQCVTNAVNKDLIYKKSN